MWGWLNFHKKPKHENSKKNMDMNKPMMSEELKNTSNHNSVKASGKKNNVNKVKSKSNAKRK